MPRFIKTPLFRVHEDAEQWTLASDCVYKSDLYEPLIIVPDGFITDLASIPVIFRSFLLRKNGKHRLAAVVHDFLCRDKSFNRVLADKIFLEAMKLCGVSWLRRSLMYSAVRLNTFRIKIL